MLAELINAKIPFISVPLPTSKNHQLKMLLIIKKMVMLFDRGKDLTQNYLNY